MGLRKWTAAACLGLGLLLAPAAGAHGIWGHVHVTGWAVENLPDGELRDFLSEPEVLNALLFGAAFTDSGYWPQSGELAERSHAYSEHTHWEPFIEDYVQWMLENDPPPWESLESRKRAAFLMGCAAHGLQDEVFDSLFLYQTAEHDGAGQGEADPGTDGFLALDGHLRFQPQPWYPLDVLLTLYTQAGLDVDAGVIEESVGVMTFIYVNADIGPEVARTNGQEYLGVIPWTAAHYLDPSIPGSLRAEIFPTARYLEALWARLHGDYGDDQLVTHVFPETPRRLRSSAAGTVDGWVTLMFGIGARTGTATTSWASADQAPVPYDQKSNRWSGPQDWSRLMRLQPTADLAPGGWYEVRLEAGMERIDGQPFTGTYQHTFQVACDDATGDLCPELADVAVASIDGPDVAEPDTSEDVGEDVADIGPDVGPDPGPEPEPDVAAAEEVVDAPEPDSASEPDTVAEPEPESKPVRGDGGCTGGAASGAWASLLALAALIRRRRTA